MKKRLDNVTLLGIDCVDVDRLKLAMEICTNNFDFAQVKILTSLAVENKNIIKIEPIDSVEKYSEFILGELDKYVDTSHVLIVQYDGFILNPDSWTDDFLIFGEQNYYYHLNKCSLPRHDRCLNFVHAFFYLLDNKV